MYGAVGRLGVDVGFSRSTLQYGEEIHKIIREQFELELRSEVLGLMIYEDGNAAIMGMSASVVVETDLAPLETGMRHWYSISDQMNQSQLTCAALINDAQFVGHADAKFILLITAVEALSGKAAASTEQISAVEKLCGTLAEFDVGGGVRETLMRTLENAKKPSIRQGYMKKLRSLLGDEDAKRFDKLYALRSSYVHEGKGRGDLQESIPIALDIAIRLLETDTQRHN
ncbi:hypothetical protein HJA_10570 [Hyphomonas jannaschiana VP2]|uniref:Apea-like HEPN domain-containing protein n=2 Tax=Hyphomonas jannaschiana TaxID=86 RepID=A0A059FBP1_9PROT|nr:hypothetical protein HJA_10570 [Hyphomonas jannaschiana VP2]